MGVEGWNRDLFVECVPAFL